MVVMDYSTELEFGVDRFLEILTDYDKLPEYLPRQMQRIEIVDKDDNLRKVVIAMTEKPQGAALVVDQKNQLLGIITEGDLRRTLADGKDIYVRASVLEKLVEVNQNLSKINLQLVVLDGYRDMVLQEELWEYFFKKVFKRCTPSSLFF